MSIDNHYKQFEQKIGYIILESNKNKISWNIY